MSFSLNISRTSITFFVSLKHNTEPYWSYSSYLNRVISSRNSTENKKHSDSHQTLVFNREFGIFIENFYLSKDYSMKNYLLSFTVLVTASMLAGC